MHAKTHRNAVEAVLFDYGLVLTGPPDPAAWERMKAVVSADETPFHEAYWRWRHDYDRGDLDGTQYWNKVAADLGQSLTAEMLALLITADVDLWTQPNGPMIDWAAGLQAAGYRTGILSNLGDAMEEGIRVRCPWLSGFTHHTFSHRLRMAKPDSVIYAYAAEGIGVPASSVLFIDDRIENIEAARRAGMFAVRYLDHASFEDEMHARDLGYLLTPALAAARR